MTVRLVCLLPVRNGAAQLPGWFESVSRFADAVVALDDGSTDGTADLLRSHRLVARVITHERRETWLGWDDGQNRNELLRAAAPLQPDWIMWLDADERIEADDAAALRHLVDHEALAGCAYGFGMYRMLADEQYDPMFEWVYRLFAFRPGQSLPARALDFIPVPVDIASSAYVRTTVRIKHYGEPDDDGRQARLKKFRQADPAGRFSSYYDNLRPLSQPPPFPLWAPRPAGHPVLFTLARYVTANEEPTGNGPPPGLRAGRVAVRVAGGVAGREQTGGPGSRDRPFVVCMLPARNCASDMADWFTSVAVFADAVVALDDGSTDDTAALLHAHPLVRIVLANPRREGYAGWDDAANRTRLLQAAGALEPDWLISVDADERVPEDDGRALRRFVDQRPSPEYAYGFPLYRMIDDLDHHDGLDSTAWRLFAYRPGQVFPAAKLHLAPIPTTIPFDRWVPTTIRMQHLAAMTEDDRRRRRAKYAEADPDGRWEPSYDYIMRPPQWLQQWTPRPADEPALTNPGVWVAQQVADLGLALSVVIDIDDPDGAGRVAAAVAVAVAERVDQDVETLVVARRGSVASHARLMNAQVRIVPVALRTPGPLAYNLAMEAARGDGILFVTSEIDLDGDVLDRLIERHDCGHGVVWLGRNADGGAAVAVSYAREPLMALGGFDQHAGRAAPMLAAAGLVAAGFATSVSGAGRRGPLAVRGILSGLVLGVRAGWHDAPFAGQAMRDLKQFALPSAAARTGRFLAASLRRAIRGRTES